MMIPIGRHNDLDNQMGGDHLQRGSNETREAVAEMTTYHVRVSRGDVFWLVHIPEIDHYTQARNLGEAEPKARDLIAVMKEIDPQSFVLDVSVELPEDVTWHLQRSQALRQESDRTKHLAAQEARVAPKGLRHRGLTVRDMGPRWRCPTNAHTN